MEDVLVTGAGIVGLMCALELRQRGADVRVLDAGPRRPSASWAGGGILSPLFPWRYPDSLISLTRDAGSTYKRWCEQIEAATGLSAELNPCGMFVCQAEDVAIQRWAHRHGQSVQPAVLGALFPGWPNEQGVWMPDVSAIRNPQILAGLRELALQRGVVIESGEAVTVKPDQGRVILSDRTQREAGRVILAAGQWNQSLAEPWLEAGLLFPVRGQMLLFQCQPGELPGILLSEEGYLIPRQDGLVLAGSTLEPGVSDCMPTQEGAVNLQAMAETLMPSLIGREPVAQWAGIRPGCSRDQPVIRPLDGGERTWLVGGHYRNGLVAAPATARLVAELLSGESGFVDPALYR